MPSSAPLLAAGLVLAGNGRLDGGVSHRALGRAPAIKARRRLGFDSPLTPGWPRYAYQSPAAQPDCRGALVVRCSTRNTKPGHQDDPLVGKNFPGDADHLTGRGGPRVYVPQLGRMARCCQ